jgi:hypothetical protein
MYIALILVDLFPFKFEFNEAISSFLKSRRSEISGSSSLMAIYLMYLNDDRKDEIKQLARQMNLTDYIMDPPAEAVSYSRSLPNTLYTNHMYDTEEYFIATNIGFPDIPQFHYKELHDHLFIYINNNFPKYAVLYILT